MANNISGYTALFDQNLNEAVKAISAKKQIMKPLITVKSSRSAIETFYQESIVELVSDTNLPREAEFAADKVVYDVLNIRPRKFGLESRIAWEDTIVSNPDLMARTTFRIANRIARDVDTNIYNAMTETQSAVNINSVATNAVWDLASSRTTRLPHEDIAKAINLITNSQLQAYDPTHLFVNPYEYAFLISNDYIVGSFDASSPDIMASGTMGRLLGLNVISHPVVAADSAAVADPRKAVTWNQVADMQSEVIRDPGKWMLLRAWEYGNSALTDPKAVCLITNTRA